MFWVIAVIAFGYYSYRYLYSTTPSEMEQEEEETIMPTLPPVVVPQTSTASPRDQIANVVESLQWCNQITKICWPYIGKIVESQLAPTVEPLINQYLPKPFSKFRFISASLGKDPLRVDRVTVHRRFQDSIALDVDVSFAGTPSVSMKCNPIATPFGIKELTWSGRLTVLLRPLIPTIPLVGAVQGAMITHPKFDMNFTGVANIADFGPVERIVKAVMKNVIASMLVLPNRYIYKLTDSVDYFRCYYPPAGVMFLSIVKGRGFGKEKKMGLVKQLPDLYCRATFGLRMMKTATEMNNLRPEWNTTQGFIISELEQPMELKCYDRDTVSRDDLVGTITLTARQLLQEEEKWYRFHEVHETNIGRRGEIYLGAQLFVFQDASLPIPGPCVVSVLIDRAENLPSKTKQAVCKVRVGTQEALETPAVVRPPEPIVGVDPANPIWNFSFDVLCESIEGTSVTLEVFDNRVPLGHANVTKEELERGPERCVEKVFKLRGKVTLRAKIIVRGLKLEKLAKPASA